MSLCLFRAEISLSLPLPPSVHILPFLGYSSAYGTRLDTAVRPVYQGIAVLVGLLDIHEVVSILLPPLSNLDFALEDTELTNRPLDDAYAPMANFFLQVELALLECLQAHPEMVFLGAWKHSLHYLTLKHQCSCAFASHQFLIAQTRELLE